MTSTAKIKLLLCVFLPIYLVLPYALHILRHLVGDYFSDFFKSKPRPSYYPPHLLICNKTSSSVNYLGPNLIVSNFANETDRILCPGDTFGDLNETYFTVENCKLEMHHHDQIIWSSTLQHIIQRDIDSICAFSLQKDGNLALYQEIAHFKSEPMLKVWESETDFNPLKTELKVQGQQLQIIHTLQNGTQRLFFTDANHQGFFEDMGEPKRAGGTSITKSHQDEDKTILQRNEYLGDLNGTNLILQTNCDLQLRNKNKTIWSFTPSFRHEMSCSFSFQEGEIGIFKIASLNPSYPFPEQEAIAGFGKAVKSQILLEEEQLLIIQTLEDGTERRFYNVPRPFRRKLVDGPKQIAHNNISVLFDNKEDLTMNVLDYIGNLSGLHIILQENCSFMLANGSQTLWEHYLKRDIHKRCALQITRPRSGYWENPFFFGWSYRNLSETTGVQLALRNNLIALTFEQNNRAPYIYHAGENTGLAFLSFVSEHSVVVKANEKDDFAFTELNYVGNLSGVHFIVDGRCNLILKNNTQVIWESGVLEGSCETMLKRDGSIMMTSTDVMTKEKRVWSTRDLTVDHHKQISTTELSVNNDGLWLVNSYTDGTVNKFKAQEGTNSFALAQVEKNEPSEISTIDL